MISEDVNKIMPLNEEEGLKLATYVEPDKLQLALNYMMSTLKLDLKEFLGDEMFAIRFNIEIGVPPTKEKQINEYNAMLQKKLDLIDKGTQK